MADRQTKKGNLGIFFAVAALIAVLIATTFGTVRDHLNLGLDLQGGFEILYEATPLNEETADVDMTAVTNSISKRVNVLGVSEPMISVEGDNRVRVQLAGVEDQETARSMIGTTANLTFRDVNDVEMADSSILVEGGASLGYNDGRPVVSLQIKDQTKFAEITGDISSRASGQNIMIIWLDWEEGDSYTAEAAKERAGEEPKYVSAATVRTTISSNCIIEGNFTEAEARTMANLINSGSLPVKLTELSSNVVSAQYGADALQTHALLEKGRNYSIECTGEKEGYVLHEKSIQIHIPQTCPETEPSAEFVFDPVIIPEPVLPEMTEPQEPAVQPAEEVKEPEKPEKKEEKMEPEKPAEEPAQVRWNVPVYIPPAVPEEIRIPEKQKDPAFSVRVIDEYGQALSNVQVAVVDSAGSPVDQWYSETQAHTVGSQVMLGETYRIHQISAPPGYQLNRTDIEFTMPQEMPQEDIVLTLRCRKAAEETPEDSTAGTGRKKVSPLLPFTLSAAATAGLLSGLYRKLRIRQP